MNDKLSDDFYINRLAMLKSMSVPRTVRQMANSLKITSATLYYHLNRMIAEGYVKTGTTIEAKRERTTYLAIDYNYLKQIEEKVTEIRAREQKQVLHGARVVKLQDKVHWTKSEPLKRNARIGSTLGTMVY